MISSASMERSWAVVGVAGEAEACMLDLLCGLCFVLYKNGSSPIRVDP